MTKSSRTTTDVNCMCRQLKRRRGEVTRALNGSLSTEQRTKLQDELLTLSNRLWQLNCDTVSKRAPEHLTGGEATQFRRKLLSRPCQDCVDERKYRENARRRRRHSRIAHKTAGVMVVGEGEFVAEEELVFSELA